jgi:3-oxoacyl-(acyl-carrier-protein) synthase
VTILALEREEDARRRGAPIRAVLSGRGERGEVRPRVGWGHAERWPEAEEAVRRAITSAGLGPSQLDWIVGGGNGGLRDLRELQTLRAACGGRLPPTSSFLGLTGESLSSSMMRVAAAVLAIEQQWLPPTWGLDAVPPGFEESLLVEGRPAQVRHVLVPSIAQGGADLAFVVSSPTAQ